MLKDKRGVLVSYNDHPDEAIHILISAVINSARNHYLKHYIQGPESTDSDDILLSLIVEDKDFLQFKIEYKFEPKVIVHVSNNSKIANDIIKRVLDEFEKRIEEEKEENDDEYYYDPNEDEEICYTCGTPGCLTLRGIKACCEIDSEDEFCFSDEESEDDDN